MKVWSSLAAGRSPVGSSSDHTGGIGLGAEALGEAYGEDDDDVLGSGEVTGAGEAPMAAVSTSAMHATSATNMLGHWGRGFTVWNETHGRVTGV